MIFLVRIMAFLFPNERVFKERKKGASIFGDRIVKKILPEFKKKCSHWSEITPIRVFRKALGGIVPGAMLPLVSGVPFLQWFPKIASKATLPDSAFSVPAGLFYFVTILPIIL
ncbi:MAG: hypothetical protein V3S64_11220 [bacterium]